MVNVAVGPGVMVITCVTVLLHGGLLVVRVTVYVPGAENAWLPFDVPVVGLPSPKFHVLLVCGELVLVKVTVEYRHAVSGAVKLACMVSTIIGPSVALSIHPLASVTTSFTL
jgi:hypothetical protein